jgi:23S rRNA (uracil1939-C5)-methyltransferase
LRLTVEKLVYGGDGLGRVDGRVVMAPFVLPGEEVRVEAVEERRGMVRGRLEEVLAPAPERVAAPCPYFARCGGCHYQHAPYEFQAAAKKSILADQLRRIGKFAPPEEIDVIAGEPWNYRNRAQFHVYGTKIGYLEANSHRLCDVASCPISSPRINETLAALRGMLYDRRWPRFIRSLMVFTNERQVQMKVLETGQPVSRRFFDWCGETISGWEPGNIDYPAAGFSYRVSRHSFFQVNRFLVDRLVATALEGAEGGRALDLYAGVGLFALPLAGRFRSVTAVDSGFAAVRDLEFSAERAGVAVKTVHDAAEPYLEAVAEAPDFVLADPPRAGLGKRVTRRLAELAPPRITIVSCDPATLARDLAELLASGYRIERLTMVDQFPQTYHLETVARLARA